MTDSKYPKPRVKTLNDQFNDNVSRAIDAKKAQTDTILREVENNFRTSIKGHIDYHKYLMQQSREKGDVATAIHHQVMMETYEGILRNYTMSNAYNRE